MVCLSPILVANKIFHVIVLLVIYFCGQFVAPEIRHSRRHCGVYQQSAWYSATRTRLKKLCLKAYTPKRFMDAFPEKRCFLHCGTQAQFTGGQKFEFLISQDTVTWGYIDQFLCFNEQCNISLMGFRINLF